MWQNNKTRPGNQKKNIYSHQISAKREQSEAASKWQRINKLFRMYLLGAEQMVGQ